MSVVEAEVAPTGRGRARSPAKPRRTGAVLWTKKRTLEGIDFEVYNVAPPLIAAGFHVGISRLSEGPFDVWAFRPPLVLVIAARLTRLSRDGTVAAAPRFSTAERAVLWDMVEQSTPGFEVMALTATAVHAAAAGGEGCECSGLPSDPVRFMVMTGPPAGPGRTPNEKLWLPEAA